MKAIIPASPASRLLPGCFQALRRAAKKALLSKRTRPGAAPFAATLEREILKLERELLSGRYKPGGYVEIELFDPKHRIVSAAPFRDQVVASCADGAGGPDLRGGIHRAQRRQPHGKGHAPGH